MATSNLYVKLDASYHEDEKILLAGEKAELLYIRGLCLAKRILSDGFVADVHLPRFGLSGHNVRAKKLVEVGLWVRDDDARGFWIVAWGRHNKSAAEVEEIREKRRKAGVKGGKRSGEVRREASSEANGKQSGSANGKHPPNPEAEAEAEAEADLAAADATADVGTDEPMPVKGPDLARRLTVWATSQGLERPDDRRPTPQVRWLLGLVDEWLGNAAHAHGARMALLGEWCVLAGSDEPGREVWGHLARLVKAYGGVATLDAMHEATTRGAGLDEQWRDDPRALTKYATSVLRSREDAA